MKILSFLALLLAWNAFAEYPTPAEVEFLLNNNFSSENARKTQLGTQLVNKKMQVMKGTFNTTVDGTTVGFKAVRDVDGKPAYLPANAIIKNVFVETLVDLKNMNETDPMFVSIGASTIPNLFAGASPAYLSGSTYGDEMFGIRAVNSLRSTVLLYGRDSSSTLYKIPVRTTVMLRLMNGNCAGKRSGVDPINTAACAPGNYGLKSGKINVWIEYYIGGAASDR